MLLGRCSGAGVCLSGATKEAHDFRRGGTGQSFITGVFKVAREDLFVEVKPKTHLTVLAD